MMSCRTGLLLLLVLLSSAGATQLVTSSSLSTLYKVAFTQNGYIQFLKYEVRLPPLQDFTFCLWLRIANFTNPQPIFSYSRNEKEHLARAWLERTHLGPMARMAVLGVDVMAATLPIMPRRWSHLCVAWSGSWGSWSLHVDGKLHVSGLHKQMRGVRLPGGGDVVVGQEYTHSDDGLDDGIEGEVFGFNLVRGAHHKPAAGLGFEWPDQELRRRGYKDCTANRGSPVHDKHSLLVSWAATPVGLFGGAAVSLAGPICGHF